MKRPAKSKPTHCLLTGSVEARKLASMMLEVLAGLTTPMDAGRAAGISLQRYYVLEARGLQGLIAALEPLARGRRRSAQDELARMSKDNLRLLREVGRLQAVIRAAHRTMGVAEAKNDKNNARMRRRRPSVRAMKAIAVLRDDEHPVDTARGNSDTKEA